jgi:hypothetical protein
MKVLASTLAMLVLVGCSASKPEAPAAAELRRFGRVGSRERQFVHTIVGRWRCDVIR